MSPHLVHLLGTAPPDITPTELDRRAFDRRAVLGRKGDTLDAMARAGLPVPAGFTLTTEASRRFFEEGGALPDDLWLEVEEALVLVELRTGRRLGDPAAPLLLSVRADAPVELTGLLEGLLDVGLNPTITEGLAADPAARTFAWDTARRFITGFSDLVLGVPYSRLQRVMEGGPPAPDAQMLAEQVNRLRDEVAQAQGAFPDDPRQQLRMALAAGFESYQGRRARYHRKKAGIDETVGVAITVQAMVFGNRGSRSGTGVATTRDPTTGLPGLVGHFLPGGQGLDVLTLPEQTVDLSTLARDLPETHAALITAATALESLFRDVVELAFTVEEGTLWLLRAMPSRRTPAAGVQIAVDLVSDGTIDRRTALMRVDPADLEVVLRPIVASDAPRTVIARGRGASPGAAVGRIALSSASARALDERGDPVILVALETTAGDLPAMAVAAAIVNARGGETSHAAVIARQMGKPCIVGCRAVAPTAHGFTVGERTYAAGEWITVDGSSGEVLEGRVPRIVPPTESGAMAELLGWADAEARLVVRANADNGRDAARARSLGAKGIGLCRTEHMFFTDEALRAMRRTILADSEPERARALTAVLPLQREAFVEILRAMDGLPVTIRLLDPPLHEFLPRTEGEIDQVARDLGVRTEVMAARLDQLRQANPMLGHRGVRVGITTPEIYRAQTRAIFEAACRCSREGVDVRVEVMIPFVGMPGEIELCRHHVTETAEQVLDEYGVQLRYKVGTMIEVPRACLLAKPIARHADFFSFGTNDLTQLVWGFAREDVGGFLPAYLEQGVMPDYPLRRFDVEGVGELVKMATERGRHANARLVVGACGEHAGSPDGVAFFHQVGLDYVSCSPFRVPVARLAAARAAMEA